MTAKQTDVGDGSKSQWERLPHIEQVKIWEEVCPGTLDKILGEIVKDSRHQRRLDWAYLGMQLLGMLCAIGTVAIIGWLVVYCVDHGAATAGAGIFGVGGAATVIGVFVNNRKRKSVGKDVNE